MTNNTSGIEEALTEATLARGLEYLTGLDPDLERVANQLGSPPLWGRPQGFATLLRIILEQKISLASAGAVYDRLLSTTSTLTPARFLALDDLTLRRIGYSRQKIASSRHLAESIVEGTIDLPALEKMRDDDVRSELIKIKGIGPWTAEIYLLRALLRPDAWPASDLALAVAVQKIKRLPARPVPLELDRISERWRPWRAVAARLLWLYYLSPSAPLSTS